MSIDVKKFQILMKKLASLLSCSLTLTTATYRSTNFTMPDWATQATMINCCNG